MNNEEVNQVKEELDKFRNELKVVSTRFSKLSDLRANNNATKEQKKELGKLKKKSADLHFKINVAKDVLNIS